MSLYNMVCGNNPIYTLYFAMLNEVAPLPDIPRFRDVYVKDGAIPAIVIYTRTGGGNRESYVAENDAMTKHPNFVQDYDDDFDSTFAHWCYAVPEKYRERVKRLQKMLSRLQKFAAPAEKFQMAMDSLKGKPAPKPTPLNESEAAAVVALLEELATELKLK